MSFKFTFKAKNAEDFKNQIVLLAGFLTHNPEVPVTQVQGSEPQPAQPAASPAPERVTQPKKPVVAPQPEKAPRAHRATTGVRGGKLPGKKDINFPPISDSVFETKPNGQGSEPSEEQAVEDVGTVEEISTPTVSTAEPEDVFGLSPKDLLELKDRMIDALQAAFRAGKVQKVRDVLNKYGSGAKSFREIDVSLFPEIEKAIQKGALA